jgi:hypothetical protein
VGYVIDGTFVPQEGALESVYDKSYEEHFAAHPADLDEMSFPAPPDEQGVTTAGYRFSPDLAWVAFERETSDGAGLYLGRVGQPEKEA